ncbi:MAG: hypothetical protein LBJ96_05880 [Holosporaceae bacterium]|nr:hypothetical protein [Holosporaceae bacterium]
MKKEFCSVSGLCVCLVGTAFLWNAEVVSLPAEDTRVAELFADSNSEKSCGFTLMDCANGLAALEAGEAENRAALAGKMRDLRKAMGEHRDTIIRFQCNMDKRQCEIEGLQSKINGQLQGTIDKYQREIDERLAHEKELQERVRELQGDVSTLDQVEPEELQEGRRTLNPAESEELEKYQSMLSQLERELSKLYAEKEPFDLEKRELEQEKRNLGQENGDLGRRIGKLKQEIKDFEQEMGRLELEGDAFIARPDRKVQLGDILTNFVSHRLMYLLPYSYAVLAFSGERLKSIAEELDPTSRALGLNLLVRDYSPIIGVANTLQQIVTACMNFRFYDRVGEMFANEVFVDELVQYFPPEQRERMISIRYHDASKRPRGRGYVQSRTCTVFSLLHATFHLCKTVRDWEKGHLRFSFSDDSGDNLNLLQDTVNEFLPVFTVPSSSPATYPSLFLKVHQDLLLFLRDKLTELKVDYLSDYSEKDHFEGVIFRYMEGGLKLIDPALSNPAFNDPALIYLELRDLELSGPELIDLVLRDLVLRDPQLRDPASREKLRKKLEEKLMPILSNPVLREKLKEKLELKEKFVKKTVVKKLEVWDKAEAEQAARAKAEQATRAKAGQATRAKAGQATRAKAEQATRAKAEQATIAEAEQAARAEAEQADRAEARQADRAEAEQSAIAEAKQEFEQIFWKHPERFSPILMALCPKYNGRAGAPPWHGANAEVVLESRPITVGDALKIAALSALPRVFRGLLTSSGGPEYFAENFEKLSLDAVKGGNLEIFRVCLDMYPGGVLPSPQQYLALFKAAYAASEMSILSFLLDHYPQLAPDYKDINLYDVTKDFIMKNFHDSLVTVSKTHFAFSLLSRYFAIAQVAENTGRPLMVLNMEKHQATAMSSVPNVCHRAIQKGVFPVWMFFLDTGQVSLTDPFSGRETLFAAFCTKGVNRINSFNADCARLFIDRYHANPNVRFEYYDGIDPLAGFGVRREVSLLELACEQNDFDLAKCLIAHGAIVQLDRLRDGPVKDAIMTETLLK